MTTNARRQINYYYLFQFVPLVVKISVSRNKSQKTKTGGTRCLVIRQDRRNY